jgi:hypothetical protein
VEYVVVAAVVAALFYLERTRYPSSLPANLGGGAPLAPAAPPSANAGMAPATPSDPAGSAAPSSPAQNPTAGPVMSQGEASLQAPATIAAPGAPAPSSPQNPVLGLPPPPSVTLTAAEAAPYIAPQTIEYRSFDASSPVGEPSTPHSNFYHPIIQE